MSRFDRFWIGLLAGLLLPLLFGWLFLTSVYHGEMTAGHILQFMTGSSMIVKFMFIAILPDMFLVFLLNTWELWRMCRGVFVALFLYVAACVPFVV